MTDGALPDLSVIYRAYQGRVVAYASRLLGREEADDVCHEVFLKVGRTLGTLADPSKLTSWIYAITLNTIRDAARKRSSRPDGTALTHNSPPENGEGEPLTSQVPDTVSRTPEEIAIRNEMIACYLDYVNELPRSYYETYVLGEFEHLSNEEISQRMHLPLGNLSPEEDETISYQYGQAAGVGAIVTAMLGYQYQKGRYRAGRAGRRGKR